MQIQFSQFGEKVRARCGILELMDDLGKALTTSPDMRMMGGGNPAAIPEVQKLWRERAAEMLSDGTELDRVLVNYDPPAGNPAFLRAVAECLNRESGWGLTEKNIAVTNGGQTAFFFLFNMLAGPMPDGGGNRRILLPLSPEYIGYSNQGLGGEMFTAHRALIEEIGDHEFKYHVDFEGLEVGEDTAAVCVSRPTNPSGNVLTDGELARVADLARGAGVPLIIDNAYGNPFPGAIFTEATPRWDEGTILTLSLSKLGLPGTRTGIVVANEEIVEAVSAMNAVVGLANNNIGQALARPLIESGEILALSRDVIRPYYRNRGRRAREFCQEAFGGRVPYRLHVHDGAFFLWFWFPGLPISSRELYRRLKERNVLVVSGDYFFFGLDQEWAHSDECIRVTFSQPEDVVREGLGIIAETVAEAYGV